ncbi:MauE/DoxX family redox-associated membrane protein [Embleya sp. NPDC001921]
MIIASAAVVRFVAALVLLYAAAQKLVAPRLFRPTLHALRVPGAGAVTILVPLVEIAAAVGLVSFPHAMPTPVLVTGLGVSFAAVAAVAMRRGERIRCACYGEAGDAVLGVRQIAALPVWVGVALVGFLAPVGATSGVRYTAALGLLTAVAVIVAKLVPLARENHSYMQSRETP